MWLNTANQQIIKKLKQSKGYTLMEMMVTVALMAVVIALAAPPLSDFIKNSRLTSTANKLVSAIILAKNEAVSRRRDVTVVGNGDGSGWTVSVIGLTTTTSVTPIANYSLEDDMALSLNPSTVRGIRFSPDGFRDLSSGAPPAFFFTVCSANINNTRIINVSTAGTTIVTKGTDGCPTP